MTHSLYHPIRPYIEQLALVHIGSVFFPMDPQCVGQKIQLVGITYLFISLCCKCRLVQWHCRSPENSVFSPLKMKPHCVSTSCQTWCSVGPSTRTKAARNCRGQTEHLAPIWDRYPIPFVTSQMADDQYYGFKHTVSKKQSEQEKERMDFCCFLGCSFPG